MKTDSANTGTECARCDTPRHAHQSHAKPPAHDSIPPNSAYTPLLVVLAYISCAVLFRSFLSGNFSAAVLMENFMGGFFLVFSLFKLIGLQKFADAFQTYDLLAARSRGYALSYPFIELLLAAAYFSGALPLITNIFTALLMFVGSIGVYIALRSKRSIQCACLGAVFELPMTKVTLFEDLLMGAMAILMLTPHLQ